MSDELDDDVSQILSDLDDLESMNTPVPSVESKAESKAAKAELVPIDDEDFDIESISNVIDQQVNAIAAKKESDQVDPHSREEIIKEHDRISAEIYDNLKSDRKQIQRVIDICYDKVSLAEDGNVKSVFVEQLVAAVKTMNDATLGQVDVLNSKAKILAALKQPGSINNNNAMGTFNLSSILEGNNE